jgi:type I restriction enzyme M protein
VQDPVERQAVIDRLATRIATTPLAHRDQRLDLTPQLVADLKSRGHLHDLQSSTTSPTDSRSVDITLHFESPSKSLGEKRKEISGPQIEEITRLYGDFQEGEKVKILPNEAFGFLRITVERPLRLRWELTEDTIKSVLAAKPIQKLPKDVQQAAREALETAKGDQFATERELAKNLTPRLTSEGVPGPAHKAVWAALSVRDEEAPIITDRKGNPEPDPELRDNENVPLPAVPVSFAEDPTERFETLEYRTAVDDYLRDEVLPYVPDAWVDHDRAKIGYEIPLTRHFYKYVPPRPLEEIDAEIKALEDEIQRLLVEVAG